jgi:ATP-binding cassette subfamily B multidrug efflux pump
MTIKIKDIKYKEYFKLLKYIRPYKKEAILGLSLTIFESILEIFIPFLMNSLLTNGVYFDNAQNKYIMNSNQLLLISLIMVGCAIIAFISGTLSSKFIAIAARGFGAELRKAVYKKIESFSFKNIDGFRQSSLITRLTDDNQIIQNNFCTSFRPLVRAPVQLVFAVIFSILISPSLSIVLFIAMLLIGIMYFILLRAVKPKYRKMQEETDILNQCTKEDITNVKTIKTYVKEDYEISRFNVNNEELRKTSIKSYGTTSLNMPITNLIMFSTTVALLYFGGIFVINGQFGVTTVNIASFLTYLSQALACFRMLNNGFTQINRAEASIERTIEVLNENIDLKFDEESILKITEGDIVFNNVSFKYSLDAQNDVLNDINLHIKKGEFIGIVGPTGSGKTTLINLINRFYDVTNGELLIDKNNIKLYSENELHKNISLCFQTAILFKGSVLDNLKFGNKYASMEDVIKACKIACCYDFITTTLQNGFNFEVSEGGTNISGGQRERICIARAIISNPKILILDDSFSALDHLTEKQVKENLDIELKDVTKIVISEKISAIKNANRIIVINEGKIENIGSHQDLYQKDPIYKDMCDSQKEGV